MTAQPMRQQHFKTVSYEEWKQHAEDTLKGKPFDSLLKETAEGIVLQPLYTEETLEKLGDALERQIRANSSRNGSAFAVAQEAEGKSAREILDDARDGLNRGNEIFVYRESGEPEWTGSELDELAEILSGNPFIFKLHAGKTGIQNVFSRMSPEQLEKVSGAILSETPTDAPAGVRTICADTVPVHLAGGTAVHELGVALSYFAEQADTDQFASKAEKFWVRFAVDTAFFPEIAKIRAFRTLWRAFCSAYGEDIPEVPVYTETSLRSYSKADPYVNLLRAGNASFSAVLGGTDVHTVLPHNVLSGTTPSGRRIARNVSLVIKEETHVRHVTDPSAGSYFIEQLTHEYTKAAWSFFLAIEEAGGYSEVVRNGWLADELQTAWQKRAADAAVRKKKLIGTNIYADPAEKLPSELNERAEVMAAKRLAEPFEQIRQELTAKGVTTAILQFGPLKEVKPASDFVSGLLAVGGLIPEQSGELRPEKAAEFIRRHGVQYAVLVGNPDSISAALPDLAETDTVIDAAGRHDEEQLSKWRRSGLSGTVHAGQNILEKLEWLSKAVEGGGNNG
ncbi:methylmalonyl-CoA mutase family protein [Indiicoccus explosivorum]|uniref:methylmalonyl-CoA mutase family protein n=1 Tax=Indiicoccus explosivorum TaxID=1917864 RepID=UPI000B451E78|nr:methylmalonyl-CoA mutase family protein [Indiicoccus explosivorum]